MFCYYAQTGGPDEIEKMLRLLTTDPHRLSKDPDDPDHVLNQKNSQSRNALYIASVNGNLKVVEFLLFAKANQHVRSKLDDTRNEKPIQGAIRYDSITRN